ncbi:Protein maternal effect lethal 26 [Halotydeus destructor]|nr:Protein maternal effect lethal 26 [Halotydeus destructor]
MSIVTEVIASNYLTQYLELHCEYTIYDGNLEDHYTCESEPFRAPFCKQDSTLIEIIQGDDKVSVSLGCVNDRESVDCYPSVSIVKCDGSKINIDGTQSYHISQDIAHEYLHDGSKLIFRYKITMDDDVSQETAGALKMFKSIGGMFTDFEIQAVGGSIKVIKNVLAVKWKYFETMMTSKCIESEESKWIIDYVNIDIVKDIVGYVYCDAITIEDAEHAYQLVEAGHRYLLDELVFACSRYLVAEVNPNNVLSLFVLSDRYNLTKLEMKCLTLLTKVVRDKDMKDMPGYAEYVKYAKFSGVSFKMSVVIKIIAANSLTQCCVLHCEYTVHNGNLRDEHRAESLPFRAPFCKHYSSKAVISQGNETVCANIWACDNQDSIKGTYNVFLVKCDGSRVFEAQKSLRIPTVIHEYLHDGSKLIFRYKLFLHEAVSPERQGLLKLFNSIDVDAAFNDFTIQAVGGSIKVMKSILTLKWKYFETMMASHLTEHGKNQWIVADIDIKIIEDIVGYVYCDAITLVDESHVVKVVEAAHRYLLNSLVTACSKYLVAEVNPGNVLTLLVLSDKYNLTDLKEECMIFIPKVILGTDMEDMVGYDEYTKYCHHVKLTQACFEKNVRKMEKGDVSKK